MKFQNRKTILFGPVKVDSHSRSHLLVCVFCHVLYALLFFVFTVIPKLFVLCHQLNRVKAVEKDKDELEEVKNEAVEYLNIENNIVKLKHKVYQKYM